jgi:hypothetical protein
LRGRGVKSPVSRAIALGVGIAGLLGWLHVMGVGLALLFWLALGFAVIWIVVPWIAVNWVGDAYRLVRGRFWAPEQGRFHAFDGVPLQVDDDGRHVWIDAAGFMRALGRREPEDAVAARHSGMWRRDAAGTLMLRVDAVVQVLSSTRGRTDPRVQRLRRYFERELLYPAGRRREMTSAATRRQSADGDEETQGPGPRP